MSLRFPNTCFVHIPRTGGIWLQELTRQLGILRQVFKGDVDSHFTYHQILEHAPEWKNLKSFSFVRNPIDWIKSRWSHAVHINAYANMRHYGIHREFDCCVRNTLDDTIKAILDYHERIVTRTYRTMTKGVKTLLRTETITERMHDYLFTTESIPSDAYHRAAQTIKPTLGNINTTTQLKLFKDRLTISDPLLEKLHKTENEAFKIWESAL